MQPFLTNKSLVLFVRPFLGFLLTVKILRSIHKGFAKGVLRIDPQGIDRTPIYTLGNRSIVNSFCPFSNALISIV